MFDPRNQNDVFWDHMRTLLNWLSAALGIGTVLGTVNLAVGVLSSFWLSYQLYVAIKYDLPIKRAKLQALRERSESDSTQPGDLR
jgi:hypothetical protein